MIVSWEKNYFGFSIFKISNDSRDYHLILSVYIDNRDDQKANYFLDTTKKERKMTRTKPRTNKDRKMQNEPSFQRREPYFLRSSKNKNKSPRGKNTDITPAFITFANGTPPCVFFDGVDEPNSEIAEKLNLPHEKYQFLDDEAKFMAQINYIMWAAGAPENEKNGTVPASDLNLSRYNGYGIASSSKSTG